MAECDVKPPEGEAPEQRRESDSFPPLPEASSGQVIGLLDYLDARGGREDVFRIAQELACAWEAVVAAVRAADQLGLVSTPGRLVVLEAEGRRFLRSSPPERTALWRKRLLRQPCFREVRDALLRPGRRVDREAVLEALRRCAPGGDGERPFRAFVDWGRRGGLFSYEDGARLFSL